MLGIVYGELLDMFYLEKVMLEIGFVLCNGDCSGKDNYKVV